MTSTISQSADATPKLAPRTTTRGRSHFRHKASLAAIGWQLLGVAVFLTGWELLARQVDYVAVLPSPSAVYWDFILGLHDDPGLRYLGVREPGYLANIGYTVGIAVLAWCFGSLCGGLLGLLSARLQLIRNLVEPILFVFGAVPVLVLAPFFLVWFGNGSLNKFILVAFYSFVTVALVAQSAALALPRTTEEYAAALGITQKRRFWAVVVPATIPAILSGLRLALSTAIAVVATVELLGSEKGAGRLIALKASQANVASILALAIAVGVVAIILDLILRSLIRLMVRWQ